MSGVELKPLKGDDAKDDPLDPGEEEEDVRERLPPVPFFQLFRFADRWDLVLIIMGMSLQVIVGCGFAAMNLIFGEVIDDLSSPSGSVSDMLSGTITIMFSLAGVMGFTALVAMWSIPYAATRIANNVRVEYLKAVLRQDMTFFDKAKPGAIVASISDDTMDFELGISVKLGEGLQACAAVFSGLAVAFYFSWQVSLICMALVPLMAASFGIMLKSGAEEDGTTGKQAFEQAAEVAQETLSAMRTVKSFGAEVKAARRFEDRLEHAEKAAIKQGNILGIGMGLMWMSFFIMMGAAFAYGGKMVIDSTKDAMERKPIPATFAGPFNLDAQGIPVAGDSANLYYYSHSLATQYCVYRDVAAMGKGDQKLYTGPAFDICACGLPWSGLQKSAETNDDLKAAGYTPDNLVDPECGCSQGDIGINSECVSPGRTTAVFFCVMIAGFLLSMIGPSVKAVTQARVAAARLYKVIDRRPTIDSTNKSGSGKALGSVSGAISLTNIHFKYPASENKIFNGVTLDIKPGETVALVGESGSGKSTVARLVSRFYDPQEGSISLDGVNIKDLDLVSLRNRIGLVSQEPLLFDTTIMENISLGKPGGATQEEVKAAAKAANAHGFIMQFPNGYETRTGVRGSKLSGGQKQRVAIARALVRKPSILVLDEATSALDNESERTVQKAIDDLTSGEEGRGLTTIVIAHRLSTVRKADRIVVLGSRSGTSTALGSEIVEVGSHDELMKKDGGLYRALVGSAGDDGTIGVRRQSTVMSSAASPHALQRGSTVDDLTAEASEVKLVEGEEEDAPGGPCACLKGKKEPDPEAEEAAQVEKDFKELDKAKLWNYTAPEKTLYIAGLSACFFNGFVWPGCGVVFAFVLTAFNSSDMDYARKSINICALMFGVIGVFSFVVQWAQSYLFEVIGERMTRRLRVDYFRTLMRQEVGWFDDPANALGVLTARLAVDIKLIRLTVGQGTGATIQSMTALLSSAIIAFYSAWQFAIAFLAVVPLLALSEAINWALMQGSDTAAKKELGEMSGLFGEFVQGIREVQSFSLESYITEGIETRLVETVVRQGQSAARGRGISAAAVQVIQLGVYALAFWIGGKMLDSGSIDFETFNVVLWSMAFGSSGIGIAANWVAQASKGKAAATRVFKLFARVPSIDARPWNEDGSERVAASGGEPGSIAAVRGELELRGVRFAYPTRPTARVFDGLNLTIEAGKTVALIGSSGSGKSTVMALIERFYDPMAARFDDPNTAAADAPRGVDADEKADDEKAEEGGAGVSKETQMKRDAAVHGSVLIDGVDLRKLDVKFLRGLIGMVGQEPVLFDASVRENILFGRPDASEEEVIAAAKAAHAHDFISAFKGGYDYVVGTRGKRVSGGQKQRIAIARAILKQPKILLLDEATSALDNESEKIVQASLDDLLADRSVERTTIVIAHRLSTVRNADCIYVLENQGDGAVVVESGSHDELMAMDSKYKKLLEAYSH